MFFPFSLIGFPETPVDAEGSDTPFQIYKLGDTGDHIQIHLSGKWIIMITFRNSMKSFRCFLQRRGTERNIIFAFVPVKIADQTEKGSGDAVGFQASRIEKDFFLLCTGHSVFLADFFTKKDMTAEAGSGTDIFVSTVLFQKSSVRTAGVFLKFFCDLFRGGDHRKRIIADIFVHSTFSQIFFFVIGKKNDLPSGIGIIIQDTGIVCDQHITGIKHLISVIFRRKTADVVITVYRKKILYKRMKFYQKNLIVLQQVIQPGKILSDLSDIFTLFYRGRCATKGRHVQTQLASTIAQCLFQFQTTIPIKKNCISGIAFMKDSTLV